VSDRPSNIPTPPRGGFAMDPEAARVKREAREAQRERNAREAEERTQRVRRYALAIAGGLFMLAGLYFLLVAPSETVSGVGGLLGRDDVRVANIHRLTLGETFTIVGAIFMGFAWRPTA
jgi:hypothetical protein